MRAHRWCYSLPVLAVLCLLGLRPSLPAMPPLPAQGPAPLLFVRFQPAPGMTVTLYQRGPAGRDFDGPVTVGLRPGYVYRAMLSGLPGRPGVTLFPTIEVRGTLQMPKVVKASDHPAPITFSAEDIDRVLRGAMLTKVVLLEDPELAIPTATRPEQPIELDVPPGGDPVTEAKLRGRLLLIVRLGEREVTPEELARHAVPNTILFPGDRALPLPACPPYVPWACVPLVDPILGPKPPTEECLRDGGDHGVPAGIDRNGRVGGLDPADTVAAYTDHRGNRRLAVSNCICICVPRFLVVRSEVGLVRYENVVGLSGAKLTERQVQYETLQPSGQTKQYEQLENVRGRQGLTGTVVTQYLDRIVLVQALEAYDVQTGLGELLGTEGVRQLTAEQRTLLMSQIQFARALSQSTGARGLEGVVRGPEAVGMVQGLKTVANLQEVSEVYSCCEGPPQIPAAPLRIYKWADRHSGQIGDVVTFFLKYSNHGGQPIENVAVSDSLTGRLEYVPGSARSDRNALFTVQENQAGSLSLHWEVSGTLPPGQSGVVSFQARIR